MGSVTADKTNAGKRYRVIYRKLNHIQTRKRGFKTKRDADDKALRDVTGTEEPRPFLEISQRSVYCVGITGCGTIANLAPALLGFSNALNETLANAHAIARHLASQMRREMFA